MGRKSRLKRERREARQRDGVVKHHNRRRFPPCSYKNCEMDQPEATHLLMLTNGNHYAACDDCVDPMMHSLKLQGVDAQVVTRAAVEQLSRAAAKGPVKCPCGAKVECSMWHVTGNGPGGGHDLIWEQVPGCFECASEPMGHEDMPHVLPGDTTPDMVRGGPELAVKKAEAAARLAEKMKEIQDEILARTVLPGGTTYADKHGEPPYPPMTPEESEASLAEAIRQTQEMYAADHG